MKEISYIDRLSKIVRNFDKDTIDEIQQVYDQSVADLDLEDSSNDAIRSVLGTPQEFVDEYIKEKHSSDASFYDNIFKDTLIRRQFSFNVIKIMQIISIVMIPVLVIIDEWSNNETPFETILMYYVISILFYYLSYRLSMILGTRTNDFIKIYYRIFTILTLVIVFNLILDDFVLGLTQYVNLNLSVLYLENFGLFVLWILPVAILSGIKYAIHRLEYSNRDIFKIDRLKWVDDLPFFYKIRSITIPVVYFFVFALRDTDALAAAVVVIIIFSLVELILSETLNRDPRRIGTDFIVSAIFIIIFYFISIGFDELIWGNYN